MKQKIFIILMFVVLIAGHAYAANVAGVDFTFGATDSAMGASSERWVAIPEFSSRLKAVEFGNTVKWNEPIRRALKRKTFWYAELGRLSPEDVDPKKIGIDEMKYRLGMAAHYLTQAEHCRTAWLIIENYKRHGVKGEDQAMNALPKIPDFPSRQDAVYWAQGQHDDFGSLRIAIEKKILETYVRQKQWVVYGEGWGEHQRECLAAALDVIIDRNPVGAIVWSYSIPWRK